MAEPYTKKYDPRSDEWFIRDGDNTTIATVETNLLADHVMAALLGVYPEPPDYPIDKPQFSADLATDEPSI